MSIEKEPLTAYETVTLARYCISMGCVAITEEEIKDYIACKSNEKGCKK